MTTNFSRDKRPTRAGTYTVQLPGPEGTQVACTLLVERSGRKTSYTMTRDEDGYVLNTLTRCYKNSDGRQGWFGTFYSKPWENFYGIGDPDSTWFRWADSILWRVANGKATQELWQAHVTWGNELRRARGEAVAD